MSRTSDRQLAVLRRCDEASAKYRAEVRETFQKFSDEALAFQSARIIGGIDREECDREIARRSTR